MKRRLFTILSAISLLLFVAVVVLWVRSYWVDEEFYRVWYRVEPAIYGFDSIGWERGGLLLHANRLHFVDPVDVRKSRELNDAGSYPGAWTYRPALRVVPRSPRPAWQHVSGIWIEHSEPTFAAWGRMPPRGYDASVRLPFWLFLCVTAICPAVSVRRRVREWRRRRNRLCRNCGYDLRATPERCPECGTVREVRT